MDEMREKKFRVSFPDPGLTREEEQALADALKSTVVAMLTDRIRGQVMASPKVNGWSEDKATE